jgi:hypothetical protein
MGKLRVGLIISGAVSLGAYEGGALAALLVGLEALRDDVVIDIIAGASAGAMTGLLSARCLTLGADPVATMLKSWVDLPDVHLLATHDDASPLSSEVLAKGAADILGTQLPPPSAPPQADVVHLSMALVHLGGLGYRISDLAATTSVDAVTHLDWLDVQFGPGATGADFIAAANAALASGANAVGFPPRLVPRSAADIACLEAAGLHNVPGKDGSWYTDGGTIDNEPFGRMLDLIGDLGDDDDARLLLMVHPLPTTFPKPSKWTDPAQQPRWTPTALRAHSLQADQNVFNDLEALVKVNTRLTWVDVVSAAIDKAMQDLAATDQAAAQSATAALVGALRGAVKDLDDQHAELNARVGREPPQRTPLPADVDLASAARAAIHRATGLSGKQPAVVEIVSPALDTSGKPPDQLLAGEKLGHFFGFLDKRFRQSDFLLGYTHMTTWVGEHLPDAAHRAGKDDLDTQPAVQRIRTAQSALDWPAKSYGDADLDTLSLGEKLHLAGLAAHVAHLVEGDTRHWNDPL